MTEETKCLYCGKTLTVKELEIGICFNGCGQ